MSNKTFAYHEAGHAVAAFVLNDEANLESKDPAVRSRAFELYGVAALSGPFAELKYSPTTDADLAWRGEWASDALRAKSCAADAVLTLARPGEPLPKAEHGAVMLEMDEALEAVETLERIQKEAKALVADRWFAISSVAAALLERQSISGDEIEAIVRSHPAGQAS